MIIYINFQGGSWRSYCYEVTETIPHLLSKNETNDNTHGFRIVKTIKT